MIIKPLLPITEMSFRYGIVFDKTLAGLVSSAICFLISKSAECKSHPLLDRLPLESKGKNFVTYVYGIRLLNLEEKCPLREDLPLHFRENYLQKVKVPLPMEEFASNC